MLLRSLLLACFPSLVLAEVDAPLFREVPVESHIYDGGWEHFVGGGVAAFDCDGDLKPELYAAGGENVSTLYRNTSSDAVSFKAITPDPLKLEGVIGAYPVDIDSDGILDLAVLRVGPDKLLRGLPDCQFELFGTDLGFRSGDHWTTAFSATWEAGQSLPTLAFGTYVDRADPDGPFRACDATLLYRPHGGGYQEPVRLEPGLCALSMLFSDWNRDGRADLRVSNDRHYYVSDGQEQLWRMDPEPRLYSSEEGWVSYPLWGMGIASRDMTGDGFSEVYLTSMGDQRFQLFDPSAGGPTWRDATFDMGTTAHRPFTGGDGRPSTGWHPAIGDVNNDGRDDIFVTKGNVDQMPVAAIDDPNNLLIQNEQGQFEEHAHAANLALMERSRGAVLADFNLDGLLDIAVVNRRAPFRVFQNVTEGANWLLVDLRQSGPNVQGVGSFVELRTDNGVQTQEILVGGGHAGGQAGLMHFGLGKTERLQIRVIGADGEETDWRDVEPNQILTIRR